MIRCALTTAVCLLGVGARPEGPTKAEAGHVKAIVARISEIAQKNARAIRPIDGEMMLDLVIKAAAAEADRLPDEVKADAFLVAVAIGLDPGNTLAKNPVTASALGGGFGGHETPDQVTTRCAALKRCGLTMRARSDWVLHWALSAGLTSRLGPDKAKSFGIAKETVDMNGPSGWSWADINADLSGIEFARRLRSGDITVKTVRENFRGSNALADPEGLEDRVTSDVFKRRYHEVGSPEMNRELAKNQERVTAHFDKLTGSRER